jgi:tetratricopeptide (TPR) repeat protein
MMAAVKRAEGHRGPHPGPDTAAARGNGGATGAGAWLIRHGPLVAFLVAAALRVAYLAELAASPMADLVAGDGKAYVLWAERIAAGDWLGRAEGVFYQAPLYPYFLAAVQLVAGPSVLAIRVVQALLGALSCALVARAGALLFGRVAGLVAGLMLALYAPAVFFDGLVQKAALDLFLVSLLLLLLARLAGAVPPSRPALHGAAVGVVLGVLMLSRENAMVLLACVVLWMLTTSSPAGARTRLVTAAALLAGSALVTAPVALRNLAIGGELHLTTSQLGVNFYLGNNPKAGGAYVPLRPGRANWQFERLDATELAEQALGRSLTPGEVSHYWLSQALEFIRGEPYRWLKLVAHKSALVVNHREIGDTDDLGGYAEHSVVLRGLAKLFGFGPLLALAAAGAITERARRRELALLLVLGVGYAASVVAFFVFARYRYPLVPMLMPLAAAGLVNLARLGRARAWRAMIAPLAAAAIAGGVSALPLVDTSGTRVVTLLTTSEALLAREGGAAEAVAICRRATAMAPHYAKAHLALGNALLASGATGEAIDSYVRALEIDRTSEEAAFNLGVALARAGRHREAAQAFEHATALNPGRAESFRRLGDTRFARNDVAGAIDAYERAVSLAPADARALNNLGAALAARGDLAGAVDRFTRALTADPAYAEAYRNLGKARLAQGRRSEAVEALERALALEPDDEEARRLLASARR